MSGLELAAIRQREWDAEDAREAEEARLRAEAGLGGDALDVADREERKKLKREAQSEAEMYAAWPEAAGVCAADKHPLDYKVNCSARARVCACHCLHLQPLPTLHLQPLPTPAAMRLTVTYSVYTHKYSLGIPTSFSPIVLTCFTPSHHDIHCDTHTLCEHIHRVVYTLTPTHPRPSTLQVPYEAIYALARENFIREIATADEAKFQEICSWVDKEVERQVHPHMRRRAQEVCPLLSQL